MDLVQALELIGVAIARRRMRPRDRRIQRRGRELMALVGRRLPKEFEITGDADSWPAVGVGLLSRMTTTLGSILDLQPAQREADAATLGRCLYEHAVHFVWLAAEPSAARLQQWRKDDLDARLTADADMRRHGVKTLTDEKRVELEAEVARLSGNKLKLEQLAIAADKHWVGKIPGLVSRSQLQSFSGLYASLYRWYSGMAHPSGMGLNRVFDDISPTRRRLRIEGEYRGSGPYGMSTVVFALALHVAARSLRWPSEDEINAVFDRTPEPPAG